MVVEPVVDSKPVNGILRRAECRYRTVGDHRPDRNTAGGSSSAVCAPAAVSVRPNVRESRQSCVFRMCAGNVPLERRNAVVSDPHAAGGKLTGRRAVVTGKCDQKRQTADTEAVYSLYYYNFLGGNTVDALPAGRDDAYLYINSCAFFKKVL